MDTTTRPTTDDLHPDAFSRAMVEALLRVPALDPDGEMWRARLRWARAQSPKVAAALQFARVTVNRTTQKRQPFDPLPFSPLVKRTRRARRKMLGQYAVRVRIVEPTSADAPGWHKKVVRA